MGVFSSVHQGCSHNILTEKSSYLCKLSMVDDVKKRPLEETNSDEPEIKKPKGCRVGS